MTRRLALAIFVFWLAGPSVAGPRVRAVAPPGKHAEDTCLACHLAQDEPRLNGPAKLADGDIHHAQGISCAGCHGGDPTSDDPALAMDRRNGFLGTFKPTAIPEMCGSCHSDAAFMLRYAPNIATDQLAQYRTSRHGLALAKGDGRVATCASCHGAHGVRQVSDGRSPVYPSRVVDTCATCHADQALMSGYGIPGDEVAKYRLSVHYAALTQKNDLSAPTCKSCHGAHGATPPGVDSVANVCGTCHPSQRERFDLSPHKKAFAAIDQPACETCHSNHDVIRPGDAWIGIGKDQICGQCHSVGDAGAVAAGAIATALAKATGVMTAAEARVRRAAEAGMLMDDAQVKLQEAHQDYVMAEVDVHTVSAAGVEERLRSVVAGTGDAERLAGAAEAELRFRRTGLFVSLGVIALAAVALILKIRAMERDTPPTAAPGPEA